MHHLRIPILSRDFKEYPKFKHNLWTTYTENPEVTYLSVSHGNYEVSTEDASRFLTFRAHCTGHNTIGDIASKAEVDPNTVKTVVESLIEAEILHAKNKPILEIPIQEIRNTILSASKLWSRQLQDTSLEIDFSTGKHTGNVVIGWILESYHYITYFPEIIEIAKNNSSGRLKDVLEKYRLQELDHNKFVLETLLRLGLTEGEVETSIPLVSTRCIEMLMKELVEYEPFAMLIIASMVEADEETDAANNPLKNSLINKYGFSENVLDPLIEHANVDAKLGHQKLLAENIEEFVVDDPERLHIVVNKLHDLKHAFDLQKLEIIDYYSKTKSGNYFPRQFVDYFAI
ncbi:hypothetical protein [Teredinibacter turnerae]|uniref:hypothetical protein n=1 Tax=Teredinibacter turnerae TaxID=2426 RepID=UPI00036664CB|nr:hypothetical protein [Teredinibacter turnerae]